jgi:hypothetical protein
VRRTEQRQKNAGRSVLFFCITCLNDKKARTLLGHPERKRRPKHSAETRARQSAARRASWTPERARAQSELARQMHKRFTAGEYARRVVKANRTRRGVDLDEKEVLKGITTRRVRKGVRNSERVRAPAVRAQEAVQLREAGRTDEQIRDELHIGERQLRNYFREAGTPRPGGRPKNRQ